MIRALALSALLALSSCVGSIGSPTPAEAVDGLDAALSDSSLALGNGSHVDPVLPSPDACVPLPSCSGTIAVSAAVRCGDAGELVIVSWLDDGCGELVSCPLGDPCGGEP